MFELLKLSRVVNEGAGLGMRMVIGDRSVVEVQKLRDRRRENGKSKENPVGGLETSSKWDYVMSY
jgi:hypothetical protein